MKSWLEFLRDRKKPAIKPEPYSGPERRKPMPDHITRIHATPQPA